MDEPQKQYAKGKKLGMKEPIYKNYPEKYKLMNTEKNKIINCQGLGWEWGLIIKVLIEILQGDGNVIKLLQGQWYNSLYIYWKTVNHILKMDEIFGM